MVNINWPNQKICLGKESDQKVKVPKKNQLFDMFLLPGPETGGMVTVVSVVSLMSLVFMVPVVSIVSVVVDSGSIGRTVVGAVKEGRGEGGGGDGG